MLILIDEIKNTKWLILKKIKKGEDYTKNLEKINKNFEKLIEKWKIILKQVDNEAVKDINRLSELFSVFVYEKPEIIDWYYFWSVVFKEIIFSYTKDGSENEKLADEFYESIKEKVLKYWLEIDRRFIRWPQDISDEYYNVLTREGIIWKLSLSTDSYPNDESISDTSKVWDYLETFYLIKKLYDNSFIVWKKFKKEIRNFLREISEKWEKKGEEFSEKWVEFRIEFKYFVLYLYFIYESNIIRNFLSQKKIDILFNFKENILNEIEETKLKIKKNKKFKDDKYYLIKWSVDYADEFYYPIFSLYSWKEMNKLWDNLDELEENEEVNWRVNFWTNERIKFDIDMLKAFMENAEEIDKEEAERYNKIFEDIPAIDIIWWFLNWI